MLYFPQLEIALSNNIQNFNELTLKHLNLNNLYIDKLINPDFEKNNIFELLFNNNFDYPDFSHKFKSHNEFKSNSYIVNRFCRISNIYIYITDSSLPFNTDSNIFGLTDEDVFYLNKLLIFRTNNIISLPDTTIDNIQSDLSKLIYIYLNIVGNNLEFYDILLSFELTDMTNNNKYKLCKLFLLYLINQAHLILSNSKFLLDNMDITLYLYRKKFDTTYISDNTGILNITNPIPINKDSVFVYLDSKLLNPQIDYTITPDSDKYIITLTTQIQSELSDLSKITVIYYSDKYIKEIISGGEQIGFIPTSDLYYKEKI